MTQRMETGKMSEADNQKDLQQQEPVAEQSAASPPEPAKQPQPPRSGGRGLASLALLVGLAASGGAGYGFYLSQLQQQQFDAYAKQISALNEQVEQIDQKSNQLQSVPEQARKLSQLAEREQQLSGRLDRLDRLPSVDELEERRRILVRLQSDQQHLAGRVEKVLGASREDWRLAEAEHLLRMAMLRLSAMQDVKSAAALINESDLILQKQDDPGAYGARQKLLESLEALRSVPELDRTGLFLQLGALRGLTSQLTSASPKFKADGTAVNPIEDKKTVQYWLNELARYVRIDLDSVNSIKPLLAGQTLGQVRLALALAVEQAQWAVLNGNTEVYRQSLKQARDLLMEHFTDADLESRALAERITALSGRQVSVTLPDLTPTLRALEVYVQERQRASTGGVDKAKAKAQAAQADKEDSRT